MVIAKRIIKDYPNYSIRSDGTVKNEKFDRKLKNVANSHGYLTVKLYNDGAKKTYRVHSLVLAAFVGHKPKGMWCAHLDGDKSNNNLHNLEWTTPKENIGHKRNHGTQIMGEKHPRTKLKEKEVSLIKKLLDHGIRKKDIEKMFRVSRHIINHIVKGDSWKEVKAWH